MILVNPLFKYNYNLFTYVLYRFSQDIPGYIDTKHIFSKQITMSLNIYSVSLQPGISWL